MRSRRPLRIALLAGGILLFLGISLLLTRWLAAENTERAAITDLLQAQARGDAPGMQHQLTGCTGACAALVQREARGLKGHGQLQIVALDSGTAHAVSSKTADTRVVWRTAGRLPTVQCVRVRRKGSVFAGMSVTLESLSLPIGRQSAC